ncbi:hypothetical protein DKX38_024569 [Salix brachista]|uniref:Uncharacterized protein n=1 Tax=Salix brachista TaxID=2182728 RepID=A0A5N5JS22_9ROSI|nr:hypothetical protein DKX38_024569 [Salix brachista]
MEASNPAIPTETNLAFAATHSKSMAPKRTKGPSFTNPSRSPNSYSRSPAHMGSFPNKPNTNHPGDNRPTCQICTKKGHMALDCYNRFNFSYQGRVPPSDLAAMAAEGNSSHTQHMWYADSGANAHITNNTANLTTSQPYEGDETITVGNGSGLVIQNMGTTSLASKNSNFTLSNVLHFNSSPASPSNVSPSKTSSLFRSPQILTPTSPIPAIDLPILEPNTPSTPNPLPSTPPSELQTDPSPVLNPHQSADSPPTPPSPPSQSHPIPENPTPPVQNEQPSNRVVTRSMTGNSKPKSSPNFTSLYSTRHPLQHDIDSFLLFLNDSFDVKDLGELSFFLGVQASRDSNGLHLRQTRFITDLLHSTNMVGAKPLNCPTVSGPKLSSTAAISAPQSEFASNTSTFANTRIDWKETPKAHVFKADLPGLKKEEVKVEIEEDRVLQISEERSKEKEEKDDTWHRPDRSRGKFLRRFRLLENAKPDQVKANMENRVLTVTLPKEAVKKPDSGSLVKVLSSIKNCTKLTELELSDCENLRTLPSSIGCVSQLVRLFLTRCKSLFSLPDIISDLKCLVEIDLCGCSKLASLLDRFCELKSLVKLDLCNSKLSSLPDNSENNFYDLESLIWLNVSYCSMSNGIPVLKWRWSVVQEIVSSTKELGSLYLLNLEDSVVPQCLPKLPSSLQVLKASDRISLESVKKDSHILISKLEVLIANLGYGLYRRKMGYGLEKRIRGYGPVYRPKASDNSLGNLKL